MKHRKADRTFAHVAHARGRRTRARAWFACALPAAIAIFLLVIPHGAGADARTGKAGSGKVLLVVIDRIGLDDITPESAPNLTEAILRGGVALMNGRVKLDQYGLGSYVIIGAGGRAFGGANSELSFNSSELLATGTEQAIPAGDVYTARTGLRAPPQGVVNLYIEEMKAASDTPQASSVPGLLGQVLKEGKKQVAVVGNADSLVPVAAVDVPPIGQSVWRQSQSFRLAAPGLLSATGPYQLTTFIHREAASIAMDSSGRVPEGNVTGAFEQGYAPGQGVRTDFRALELETARMFRSGDVVVVDTAQTSRVDEQADYFSETVLASARRKALEEADAFVGRLSGLMDFEKDLLVVCTPTPTRQMLRDGDLLTPLVVRGREFDHGTRLYSPTTRRDGLVSNYDIAPTVLDAVGLETPVEMDGRPLEDSGARANVTGLREFEEKAVAASVSRKMMVRVYAIGAMCVIALFFLVMLIRSDSVRRHPLFWAVALMVLLCGPLAWLFVPLMGAAPQWAIVSVAVAGSILIALGSMLLRDKSLSAPGGLSGVLFRPLLAVSGFTLVAIITDTLMGSPLMGLSAFGSDAVLGDRYYGVGNLYMGFAIGAAVLFVCVALQWRFDLFDRRWKAYAYSLTVLVLVALVLGLPWLGADVGGLATTVVVALVLVMLLSGGRVTAKRVLVMALVLLLCVGALVVIDALAPGSASHAGRAVGRARSSGFEALASQVSRKLAANWMLTWASIWRLVLLFGAVAFVVFNLRFGILDKLAKEYPCLRAGFWALAAGLVAGWLLNDSGIEAAGAMSVFLFVPFFLLLIPWARAGGRSEDD